jgi:hypothetical protein
LRDQSGRDRDPSVAGSSGLENSYIFDGVTRLIRRGEAPEPTCRSSLCRRSKSRPAPMALSMVYRLAGSSTF